MLIIITGYFFQFGLRKLVVYGAIGVSWIVVITFLTFLGSMTTGIVNGICIPWGVYRSYAGEKAFIASGFFFTYLLPLMMMLFCYSRIIYALRLKVTLAYRVVTTV